MDWAEVGQDRSPTFCLASASITESQFSDTAAYNNTGGQQLTAMATELVSCTSAWVCGYLRVGACVCICDAEIFLLHTF